LIRTCLYQLVRHVLSLFVTSGDLSTLNETRHVFSREGVMWGSSFEGLCLMFYSAKKLQIFPYQLHCYRKTTTGSTHILQHVFPFPHSEESEKLFLNYDTASIPECFEYYSRTPLVWINWDGEPSRYAENPGNWIF